MILPPEARPLVAAFMFSFTNPTYQRFSTLLVGALLTTGRRTVANLLRTLRHLAPGHRTDYQRVLSRAPWSGIALGCALMRLVLDRLVPGGPVVLVGDDTDDGHKGKHVYGAVGRGGRDARTQAAVPGGAVPGPHVARPSSVIVAGGMVVMMAQLTGRGGLRTTA